MADDSTDYVIAFFRGQGNGLPADYRDPQMTVVKRDKKLIVLGFNSNKAVWRDSKALFCLGSSEGDRPPEQISWLAELVNYGYFQPNQVKNISAIGLCTEPGKAKIHFWRQETLPIPLAYLKNQDLVNSLQSCLEIAEKTSTALYSVTLSLIEKFATDPDKSRIFNHFNPQPHYWSTLEPKFYQTMNEIAKLGNCDPQQIAEKEWAIIVFDTALEAFKISNNTLDRNAKTLKAITEAESRLYSWLLSDKKSPLGSYVQHIKEVKYGSKP